MRYDSKHRRVHKLLCMFSFNLKLQFYWPTHIWLWISQSHFHSCWTWIPNQCINSLQYFSNWKENVEELRVLQQPRNKRTITAPLWRNNLIYSDRIRKSREREDKARQRSSIFCKTDYHSSATETIKTAVCSHCCLRSPLLFARSPLLFRSNWAIGQPVRYMIL